MLKNNIKILIGIADDTKDELLDILIKQAKDDANRLCGRNYGIDTIIERMVVFLYNRLGTEGLNSESYSGVSYNYSSDYPEYILNALESAKGSAGKLRTM